MLAAKQKVMLGPDVNEHKLIVDVTTRWNSSLDMLERYLTLQPALLSLFSLLCFFLVSFTFLLLLLFFLFLLVDLF